MNKEKQCYPWKHYTHIYGLKMSMKVIICGRARKIPQIMIPFILVLKKKLEDTHFAPRNH